MGSRGVCSPTSDSESAPSCGCPPEAFCNWSPACGPSSVSPVSVMTSETMLTLSCGTEATLSSPPVVSFPALQTEEPWATPPEPPVTDPATEPAPDRLDPTDDEESLLRCPGWPVGWLVPPAP
jgi:hypothetical protein